jgi:hypothetical protein
MQNSRGQPLPLSTGEQGGGGARGWRRRLLGQQGPWLDGGKGRGGEGDCVEVLTSDEEGQDGRKSSSQRGGLGQAASRRWRDWFCAAGRRRAGGGAAGGRARAAAQGRLCPFMGRAQGARGSGGLAGRCPGHGRWATTGWRVGPARADRVGPPGSAQSDRIGFVFL